MAAVATTGKVSFDLEMDRAKIDHARRWRATKQTAVAQCRADAVCGRNIDGRPPLTGSTGPVATEFARRHASSPAAILLAAFDCDSSFLPALKNLEAVSDPSTSTCGRQRHSRRKMNQAGWLVLLTLIVWSRCDPQLESPQLDVSPEEQWDERTDDESTIEAHGEESQLEPDDDIDPSASSTVQSVKNQSELSASLAHLIKSHNLYPQLESLKKSSSNLPSDQQKHFVSDLLKGLAEVGNSSGHEALQTHSNKDLAVKSVDIGELKRYYEQIKMDETRGANEQATSDPSTTTEFHANHNYFAKGDWQPLISTADHRLSPPDGQHHSHDSYQVPSSRVASFAASEMPSALANFYVDSDQYMLHAHESQNKADTKETKEVASNLANTVKDLISTKTDTAKEKLTTSLSHKPSHVGYVPVENGGEKTYQEYVSCCDQLFKNYGNKEHIHEDIYLVPKGEDPHRFPIGHPMMVSPHPGAYMRGYPGFEPEVKIVGPGKVPSEYPPSHLPVQCLEEHHRGGHLVPAYHGSHHHPRPMYHYPPAALLLKKKLALIGKKYFFGK